MNMAARFFNNLLGKLLKGNGEEIRGERKESGNELRAAHEDLIRREKALRKMFEEIQKSHFELKETQKKLVQSEKLASIGLLAAGIVHEIKNPIGFLNSNLQMLEEYVNKYEQVFKGAEELKEAVKRKDVEKACGIAGEMEKFQEENNWRFIAGDIKNLLRESRAGGDRIKKIVMDLRVFSCQDSGEMEFVKIEEVMESVLNIVWNEIKYKAQLKKDYRDVPRVRCNTQKLGQVFINLLINATQAIEHHGFIRIATYREDQNVCVEISDTGKGIRQEDLGKVFEPFFTTKTAGEGTGLGLSISRDIIRQHGGEITVRSETGQGTTFIVRLPAGSETDQSRERI